MDAKQLWDDLEGRNGEMVWKLVDSHSFFHVIASKTSETSKT